MNGKCYLVRMKMRVGKRSSADTTNSAESLSVKTVERHRLRHSILERGVVTSIIRI